MILNNAPQNEAVLSNVGEIGEFRIRNSAKAFNILSSGLYANKVRAIIRELSCNALDSHTAAGTKKQFDLHIPTHLEPFFAIRDYGTGLNHEQVTNIYTTYFESTKTNSNDFIGALGLGSKSPFSYTDNFTVTAIKDGRKGIYTAFINDSGVPSIAMMAEEQTDEPSGVEIRFGVEDSYDFRKFETEANQVFKWFKESDRPNFTGKSINVETVKYETENLIPGVHVRGDGGTSMAIMGNIAYPIDVPQSDKTLGELRNLLSCGLMMEFGIGELDFQASREGLSYIPQTIEAIKKKLELVNDRLSAYISEEVTKIDNTWMKSFFLCAKRRTKLFGAAVVLFEKQTNFPLATPPYYSNPSVERSNDAMAMFNISVVGGFSTTPYNETCSKLVESRIDGGLDQNNNRVYSPGWSFSVDERTIFVENDTKVGALERAKHHFRTADKRTHNSVYVLAAVDKSKPMDMDGFYASMHNPPEKQRMKVSDMRQKVRASGGGMGKNVTIMTLEERGGPRWQSKSKDLVWRAGDKAGSYDANKTHYYIPLSGFTALFKDARLSTAQWLANALKTSGIKELETIEIHGVRKGDIEEIKKAPNWVNLEDHVSQVFKKLDDKAFLGVAATHVAKYRIMKYNIEKIVQNIRVCEAFDILKKYVGAPTAGEFYALRELTRIFMHDFDLSKYVNACEQEFEKFNKRYMLIEKFSPYDTNEDDVIHYINLIDNSKTN